MKTEDILPLIPRRMYADGTAERITLPDGTEVTLRLIHDAHHGAPWEECDGHGPVSEWRPVDSKRPGERILHKDGRSARFYDFAEAARIARRDKWGSAGDAGLSAGAKAARAVKADMAYLRSWCTDKWHYMGVVAEIDGEQASLWGVESSGDYWRTVAAEVIAEAYATVQAARDAQDKAYDGL